MISDKDKQTIQTIARSHGAHRVLLFGSFARETATADSDLDLLVEIEPDRSLLDLIVVTAPLRGMWNDRTPIPWEGMELTVLTRKALIALKTLRSSPQDLEDIKRLEETTP